MSWNHGRIFPKQAAQGLARGCETEDQLTGNVQLAEPAAARRP